MTSESSEGDTHHGPHIRTDDIVKQPEWMGNWDAFVVWGVAAWTAWSAVEFVSSHHWFWLAMMALFGTALLYELVQWGNNPTVDEAKRTVMANVVMNFLDDAGIEETTATATDEQGREYRTKIKKIDGEWMAKKVEP